MASLPAAAHLASPNAEAVAEHSIALLGPSSRISALCAQIRNLAPYFRHVLLTGPPHCGQEAVARLMHFLSPYPKSTFVVVPALSAEETLALVSEGERSSNAIVLFLPNVDQLSIDAQCLLLRILRKRRPRKVCVVAACTQDLRALAKRHLYVPVLAEMLRAPSIVLPSLNERQEDIPMLLEHALQKRCVALNRNKMRLSAALFRAVMDHPWDDNFEELRHVADALIQAGTGKAELDLSDWKLALSAQRREIGELKGHAPHVQVRTLEFVIQEHIASVLRLCEGNKKRAAQTLGVSRSTLYRILKEPTASLPGHPEATKRTV